jgi:hypothetical protein
MQKAAQQFTETGSYQNQKMCSTIATRHCNNWLTTGTPTVKFANTLLPQSNFVVCF